MNVIMVQPQFEQPILGGIKQHTIRPPRKDGRPRAVVGQNLSIRVWTGKPYRSKQREIKRTKVKFVFPVQIDHSSIWRPDISRSLSRKYVAIRDGFANWNDLKNWFKRTHGLPFEGVLIHWEP